MAWLEHDPRTQVQHVGPGGAGALRPSQRPAGELQHRRGETLH